VTAAPADAGSADRPASSMAERTAASIFLIQIPPLWWRRAP
jgi:hypothetical protein